MPKYEYTTEARHGIPVGVKLTDMMRQYIDAKTRYPEALLFFRMGDFYEMFFEDAELGGLHLGLTVTSRNKDAAVQEPMSGFPHSETKQMRHRTTKRCTQAKRCKRQSGRIIEGFSFIFGTIQYFKACITCLVLYSQDKSPRLR